MNGKTPNPTEVIITAQSWTCRFKEAFETKKNHDKPNKGIQFNHKNIGGCWDLIIKIAGARKARPKRTSFAYEASNLQGRIMFSGCASSGASTITTAMQEALVVSAIKAKSSGFCRILIMCCSKSLVSVCNLQCSLDWQQITLLSDLAYLQQQGLCYKTLFVPRVILGLVCNTAKFALKVPGPCCWVHLAFV